MFCEILASQFQHIRRHRFIVCYHLLTKINVHQSAWNCHSLGHVRPHHLVSTFPFAVETPSFQPNLAFLSCSRLQKDIQVLLWKIAIVHASLHLCHHQCSLRQGWPILLVACICLHPRRHEEVSAASTEHAKDLHDGPQLCGSMRSLLSALPRLSQLCPALDSGTGLLCIEDGPQSCAHGTAQTKEAINAN